MQTLVSKRFFLVLLILTMVASYMLLKPYLSTIVLALITVIIFKPAYNFWFKTLRERKSWSTLFTILTVFVVLLVPLGFVVNLTIRQTRDFYNQISEAFRSGDVNITTIVEESNKIIDKIPYVDYELTEEKLIERGESLIEPLGSVITGKALNIVSSTADIFTHLIIYLMLIGTIFPNYENILKRLSELSPLSDEIDRKYISRTVAMIKSMVKGNIVISLVQSLIVAVTFWIFDVQYIFFWTILMFLLGIVPLGAGVVAFPIAIILILLGDTWAGITIILMMIIVVNNIDNVLRPMLVSSEAQLPSVLIILSVFSGVKLFGAMGIIYGPVLMILIVTTLETYLTHYKTVEKT